MIGAIIQARTNSTRLPNKVLMRLPINSGKTVLEQVLLRTKTSKKLDVIIVATTTNKEDDEIVKICLENKYEVFRGDQKDVLKRFYECAIKYGLNTIVRITSDCPCIDSEVIDECIDIFMDNRYDYVTNSIDRTYPHGMDVEVFTFDSLKKAFDESSDSYYREHVTPYIAETCKFHIFNKKASEEQFGPDIRITLDTYEDYLAICAVYDYLYSRDNNFNCKDIVKIYKEKPWIYFVNNKIIQKRKYSNKELEIKDAIKILEVQEMKNAADLLKLNLGAIKYE